MSDGDIRIGNRSDALEILDQLINDTVRVYRENGRTAFDAGRIDSMKQSLEALRNAMERGIL